MNENLFEGQDVLPKKIAYNMELAAETVRVLKNFYTDISKMDSVGHIESTLQNLADMLRDNPKLKMHIKPFKIAKIIAEALFRNMYRSFVNAESLSEGEVFLFRYFFIYVYSDKCVYLSDADNLPLLNEILTPLHPHEDVRRLIGTLGSKTKSVENFVVTNDLKVMQTNYIAISIFLTPHKRRMICNFLKVYLTAYCLHEIFSHSLSGYTFPVIASLNVKCKVMEKLFDIHTHDDYKEFFDKAENVLFEADIRAYYNKVVCNDDE